MLETHLTELGALAIERRMIKWWGRKDLGTGILQNRTDGGDGCSGLKLSEETKRKMSIAKTGTHISEEHKQKISKARSCQVISEETRQKLSEANKRRGSNFKSNKGYHWWYHPVTKDSIYCESAPNEYLRGRIIGPRVKK
jgi:hypothetical protein